MMNSKRQRHGSHSLLLSRPVVVGGLVVAFALVVTTALLSTVATRGVTKANASIARVQSTLISINQLRAALADAEAGQRGFILTGAPDYLQSYSESLEHLAFACEGDWPAPGIRKMQAVSEQLSPAMRRRIETTTGARVAQNYGLNEIGLAAAQCAAGNYHVHVEHCIAEIVDEAGAPCAPGVAGRLVLTALKNPAMPLLRYDSGDMARAVAGPCPCGPPAMFSRMEVSAWTFFML